MGTSRLVVYMSEEEAERIRDVADTHNIPVARMLRKLALLVADALESGSAWPEVEVYIHCLYKKNLARADNEESVSPSSMPVLDLDTHDLDQDHDHGSHDHRSHDHDHESHDRRNHDHDHDLDHEYYNNSNINNKVLNDSNNSNLSFDFSDEKSKTEIRTRAPQKKFARRKKSDPAAPDPAAPDPVREPWQAVETAWLDHTGESVPSPRFGRFRKGIQQLARFCMAQGWSVEETVERVLACYDWCKRDPFWTGKTLYPDALLDRILPWYRDVHAPSESGRHVEAEQPDYAAIAAAYRRRPKLSTNGTTKT